MNLNEWINTSLLKETNMKSKRSRSAAWAMVNWAIIEHQVKQETTMLPESVMMEKAISEIESKYTDDELFVMEAEKLEELLIKTICALLNQTYGRDIKRNKTKLEREKRLRKQNMANRPDVRLMKIDSLDELKDLGLDPDMMEKISKSMMDQLFGKKKKKDSKDDDEDDDPGASFYM